MRSTPITLVLATGALVLAGCGSSSSTTASSTTAKSSSAAATTAGVTDAKACAAGKTLTAGKLTVATGQPAYSPWVIDDKPESGQGFESSVAYAVADQLGFAKDAVTWVRTGFDEAIQPGPKSFDVNLQQFSITPERAKIVSFSDPYYTSTQALVTLKSSKFATAKTVADLKGAKLGAQTGTTSLDTIKTVIKPTAAPSVFDTNEDAKAALQANQIDGLVVDLPTAFGIAYGDLGDNGAIPGQFPADPKLGGDQLGFLLSKDSPLVPCVNAALKALTTDGTLGKLADQWLKGDSGVAAFGS